MQQFLPVTVELWTLDELDQSSHIPQENGCLFVVSYAMANGTLLFLINSCYN